MTAPAVVSFPNDGVWRVGRAPDPLQWHLPQEPVDTSTPGGGGGNRFDSFHGNYGVLYFGTSLRACYAETLARFRPSPKIRELVRADWEHRNWMDGGSIAADWRDSRIAVRVTIPGALPFIDVASADTLNAFRDDPRIRGWLEAFELADFDLSNAVGQDRRVTRLLSQWAAETVKDGEASYGGIRYLSRHGSEYECWAVFQHTDFEEIERRPILASDEDLRYIAGCYRLTIH